MNKKLLILYLVSVTFSCSNDNKIEELEKKIAIQEANIKSKNDSLSKVILETEKKQKEVEAKLLIEEKNQKIEYLISQINSAKEKLAMAKTNLNNVSSFKIGRSSSTRNSDIQNAEIHVENWKKNISDLETELENLNKK